MTATLRRIVRPSPAWLVLLAAAAAGQEAKDGPGKWQPVFQLHASDYVIRAGPDAGAATMLPQSILRWSQPIRGGDDGALYLWTDKGRPVAVIGFLTFKWPSGERVVLHERHSLAPGPLTTTWRGQAVWEPTAPGLTFRPLPDAPAPAATAADRLRQMQAVVRDVAVVTTDDQGSTWTARALPRPLHRYEPTDGGASDGALFALAQGNDAEVFVLLEARGQGKQARWEYAIARFTDLVVRVDFRGRRLFDGGRAWGGSDNIYFVNQALTRKSDAPDDFR